MTEPNIQSAGSTDEPAGGMGDSALLSDPDHIRADTRMVGRALRNGWPIKPEHKALLVETMVGIAKTETVLVATEDGPVAVSNARNQINATRNLIAMEAQNQADDHLQDKNDRLDTGKLTENAGLTFNIIPCDAIDRKHVPVEPPDARPQEG